jgi:hypothetical protein
MTLNITTLDIGCHYAECRNLFIVMLNVMPSVVMNIVMLNVIAPLKYDHILCIKDKCLKIQLSCNVHLDVIS